jgi:hypothetical protein
MYELASENLTHLGGPMGSDYTYDNWRKFFTTIELAKKYAEKDYKKNKGIEVIEWIDNENEKDCIQTQDLGFVMYYIRTVKCEK